MKYTLLIFGALTLACSTTDPAPPAPGPATAPNKTSITETIEPSGTPTEKEVDYSSGPPERVFQCSRPANVLSDEVGVASDDPNLRFEIRYTTDCLSTLWLHDGAQEVQLDPRERLYMAGSSLLVAGTRVACFGVMSLGSASSFTEGTGHHIDSTSIECATRSAAGWSPPEAILTTAQHGTWLLGLEADPSGAPVLVTMRDSLFSPAVMTMRGRPASDGFWQHGISVSGSAVQLGQAIQRAPMQFQQK